MFSILPVSMFFKIYFLKKYIKIIFNFNFLKLLLILTYQNNLKIYKKINFLSPTQTENKLIINGFLPLYIAVYFKEI
jgi:hypothetical protein